ncbi:MAG: orotate phosphoribosyltransferase-like protein [Thermoplasmatota archaeon]
MKEIDALIKKALKYKESGLTDHEIAEDLNVSKETAIWLLNKGKKKKPEGDLKVGWRSLGVYPSRMSFISDAICDVLLEEIEEKELEVDTILGIAINGIPYATFVAEKLGLELSVYRPHDEKSGSFSSNYADIKGKKIIIVDDVVGTGDTFRSAISAVKKEKGDPALCVAILNKKKRNDIDGVPLRALIRARVI